MGHRRQHHDEAGPPHDAGLLDGGTEAPPEIVMFFLGPDGEFLHEDPHVAPRRTIADVRRAWHTALETEAAHDPFARNRLGPRPVQGTGRPAKSGYLDEIVVTALSSPERAVSVCDFSGPVLAAGEPFGRRRVVDHQSPLCRSTGMRGSRCGHGSNVESGCGCTPRRRST